MYVSRQLQPTLRSPITYIGATLKNTSKIESYKQLCERWYLDLNELFSLANQLSVLGKKLSKQAS